MLLRILLAAESKLLQKRLRSLLDREDAIVEVLPLGRRAWERVLRESSDVVVASRSVISEPAPESISALRSLPESPEVLVLVSVEDPEDSARLAAAGCSAIVLTDLPDNIVREAITSLLERRRQAAISEMTSGPSLDRPRLSDFVSLSPRMQTFLDVARRVTHSDSTLLIEGETGVGKEHLARAIHAEGPRSNGPFVAINCGALTETLLESELFGHEEGAFTGAHRTRRGWFELAHRGTIFLDEIGEMPSHLQVKLLRVLQSKEVQRVGGDKAIGVDVRVMAATNRDLKDELDANRFRPDLYYRLSVVRLSIPPLCERREDIPAMLENYIHHFQGLFSTTVTGIDAPALRALEQYDWPGNVRELINIVERAMLLGNERLITVADLPEELHDGGGIRARSAGSWTPEQLQPGGLRREWLDRPLKEVRQEVVEDLEKLYLTELLRATEGRVGETANRAGIQPRSLFEKMRRYGLHKEDFRPRYGQRG